MNTDVLRAINAQINSEFRAWYQYLAMAAFCDREKFTGAANWLRQQSLEEYQHGMKLSTSSSPETASSNSPASSSPS
jgi:ferritin